MRLCEHPDFDQAILRAADGLRPAIIEKDYYVTEVLRVVGNVGGDGIIFKGGTSLSKGWNLINRFSEDIDVFVDPQASDPPLGRRKVDATLKRLRDRVAQHTPLQHLPEPSRSSKGIGREDHFAYEQIFGGPGEVAGRVLLEAGIASGREPTEVATLSSLLAKFLVKTGLSLGCEDEAGFEMRLLHFRRTFVEKLFAIHKRVELYVRDGVPIGPHARHYYDLSQLMQTDEVITMLNSDEYSTIKADYDAISRRYFPDHYFFPEGMRFANSAAIFPQGALQQMLAQEYEKQCTLLCYGPYPDWATLCGQFTALRSVL